MRRLHSFGHDLLSQTVFTLTVPETSFYAYDGHGSVRTLTHTTGQVTDVYDYDVWGNLLHAAGTTDNVYLYTGEQWDGDLGMYFLRARYMDPNTGRFHNMDPFEGFPASPISLSKYLYANANAANSVDPSGYFTLVEITTVVLVVGLLGTSLAIGAAPTSQASAGSTSVSNQASLLQQAMPLLSDPVVKNGLTTIVENTYMNTKKIRDLPKNERDRLQDGYKGYVPGVFGDIRARQEWGMLFYDVGKGITASKPIPGTWVPEPHGGTAPGGSTDPNEELRSINKAEKAMGKWGALRFKLFAHTHPWGYKNRWKSDTDVQNIVDLNTQTKHPQFHGMWGLAIGDNKSSESKLVNPGGSHEWVDTSVLVPFP